MLDILQHEEDLAPRACPPPLSDHPSPKLGDFASIFDIWNGLSSSQSEGEGDVDVDGDGDGDGSDRTLTDSEVDDTSTSVESVDSAVAAKNSDAQSSILLPLHIPSHKHIKPASSLAVGGLFGGLDFAEVMAAGGISSDASLSGSDTRDSCDSDDEDEDGDETAGADADDDISDSCVKKAERIRAERIKIERSIKASIKAERVRAERAKAERLKAERFKSKNASRLGNKKDQRDTKPNSRSTTFLPSALSPALLTAQTLGPAPSFTYDRYGSTLLKHAALYSPLAAFAPVVFPSVQQNVYIALAGTAGDVINPSYLATSQEKLAILEAKLQHEYDLDSTIRRKLGGKPGSKPIHVFVDLSNIVIGFYMRMRALRNMPPMKRLAVMPPFFFTALARIIERGRPAARKVTAGSVYDSAKRSDWPHYMDEAEALGYEMNILSRVSREAATPSSPGKRNAQQQHKRQKSGGGSGRSTEPTGPTAHNESGSEESTREEKGPGATRMGEQAVDEILQLKMCHSVLDHKAGTIVLATGDAAEAEFSDGFLRHVERAMSHGWRVELVSWTLGISKAWRELERRQKRGSQSFRIIELDTYAEELLGIFAE